MNNDLISREALSWKFLELILKHSEATDICDFGLEVADEIENAPAVDAVEVKHGRWVEFENSIYDEVFYRCSSCGEDFCFIEGSPADNLYKYCPNCGARMDGE